MDDPLGSNNPITDTFRVLSLGQQITAPGGTGGAPGGASGDAQTNDGAGGFAGSSDFHWDQGTLTLTISGNVIAGSSIFVKPPLGSGFQFMASGALSNHILSLLDSGGGADHTQYFQAADGILALTTDLPTPAALTKTDDTNVTLTLGGTPATALLQAVSLTLGWTGTLSPARGGTGVNNATRTLTINTNNAILDYSGAYTLTVAGNASISGTNTGDQTIPTPANPTATVGLTAVNGSATTTFTRSDGAPALSQAIAPTWTGTHIWQPTTNATSSAVFKDHAGAIIANVDSTNIRFGVGTATPVGLFNVSQTSTGSIAFFDGGAGRGLTIQTNTGSVDVVSNGGSSARTYAPLILRAGSGGVYISTGNNYVGLQGVTNPLFALHIETTGGDNTLSTVYIKNSGTGATDNAAITLQAAAFAAQLFTATAAHGTIPSSTGFYTTAANGFVIYPASKRALRVKDTLAYFYGDGDAGKVGISTPLTGAGVTYENFNVNGNQLFVGVDSIQESPMFQIVPSYPTNTHASYKARAVLSVWDAGGAREAIRFESNGSAAMIGVLGHAAQALPAAYTVSGSATRAMATDPSSAFTGIDNAQVGTVYAQLADLNTLRTAVSTEIGVMKQLLSDLAGYGWTQ